jgi:hypothetical protein
VDVVYCGAVRILDLLWLSCLPPLMQLSQAWVSQSVTSPTRREGLLNAGVYSTFLKICCQVLVCYDLPFPAVRHNGCIYRFYWRGGSG